jgi:cytochrome c-type biogenesis protein CcmH
MALWLWIGIMCVAGTLFVAWPLYRQQRSLTPPVAASVVVIIAISLGLYAYQGRPNLPSASGDAGPPDIEAMVASLASRLQDSPDDVDGWKMLGRSYMTLQDFGRAVSAYERAVELEESQNAQTLTDLGAAILERDRTGIEGRTSALFESALALEPNNPSALFYGGIAALNRGDKALAIERWEFLLSLNPPDNIRGVLEQRIAEWRGESSDMPSSPVNGAEIVTASVTVPEAVVASLPGNASVFIIARDPAQPSPPIAVTRRQLAELPATVSLGDADAMIPGRNLSMFNEFEIVARVSVSGQPVAQSGDWYASALVRPADDNTVTLLLDQQVP